MVAGTGFPRVGEKGYKGCGVSGSNCGWVLFALRSLLGRDSLERSIVHRNVYNWASWANMYTTGFAGVGRLAL